MKTHRPKIVLLLGAPFTEQNIDRMGLEVLSRNFEVVVFDCMPWMNRTNSADNVKNLRWKEIESVKTDQDFRILLERYEPDYAIDFIGQGRHTLKIGKILKRHNVGFIIQKLGSLPTIPKKNFWKKVVVHLKSREGYSSTFESSSNSVQPKKLGAPSRNWPLLFVALNKVKYSCYPIALRITTPYAAILSGNKSRDRYTKFAKHKIWAASGDFHTFQNLRNQNSNLIEHTFSEYLVFIDDCLTQALDWATLGIQPPVIAESYFMHLNRYFNWLELQTGLPIFIAGHPNSKYDKSYRNRFCGRRVIYGNTAELVTFSQGALIHASTAVSYAILSKKPVISIISSELDSSFYGENIRAMSEAIGCNLVFIDRAYSKQDLFRPINSIKYHNYQIDHLKSELSTEELPWQSFVNFAKKMHP